ncbi:putative ABC transport system permease protein [Salinibacterium amurskyense]|uniref:Putative ABC transport system permease protein n=1 Tax=Salinibacterium amurskyense TaxID=205941 RepID=A0A2M9D7X8_9MICO|nr:ABC transporter permease [Salinibacterium amurskyense]PJJ81748.1 putative ABC transport system permease protein [Salinibacterium amurskyense]RLQ83723.1 FtsX-like permease family protein [Salinibacterium amurskyense]GHD79409.1 permease [Salinibacterium amurskyense]
MKTLDLFTTAVANTFRSKTRTILTILAIFVGAFTLTITNGLGTGINQYIDDTVTSIGAEDVMTVTVTPDADSGFGGATSGPTEYDPEAVSSGGFGPNEGGTVVALTPELLDDLADVDGVLSVEATKSITPDWIQYGDGTQYVTSVGGLVAGQSVQLAAGEEPDATSDAFELDLPISYVEPLGFSDADAAVGETITIAITDAERTQHLVDATVVGVAEESVAAPGAGGLVVNAALTDSLYDTQNIGLPDDQLERYATASIRFDANATDADITALKDNLADAGFTGTTVADQLGTIKTVIDAIVLVLNAFAIIALLAASFGIVNTLFMSVQERTREIGLMKAMGMGGGKIFGLFSLEAVFIGFLGSAIGAGIGMLAGTAISSVLSGAVLADLPGLTLIAFDPLSITVIILVVMAIAFLAGTLPAARAAKADPVESLRYE